MQLAAPVRLRMAAVSTFEFDSVIRGHQASKHLWTPVVEETLDVQLEPSNPYDSSAVAVLKDGAVIGHVPREVRRHFNQFLQSGGSVTCEVIGHRKYGKGLEVPCVYRFQGSRMTVRRAKRNLAKFSTVVQ